MMSSSPDALVYGATPGGIAAALTVARMEPEELVTREEQP